jgi:hypothetical protein
MPIHDWTRVSAGTYHHMHQAWITELSRALNNGILPPAFYALAEQVAGRTVPDVLTLEYVREGLAAEGFEARDLPLHGSAEERGLERQPDGAIALAEAPPRVHAVESVPEATILTLRRRRIVIRHATDDRVVALLEIVSPGNKSGAGPMQAVLDKAVAALQQGYHLLMIDLFPPGPADPRGLHDRVWRELEGGRFEPPAGKPLTLAAYRVGDGITAYVEPVAVGQALPDMPLFLDPDHYVNVPLESTYVAAYEGVPRRWRQVIEAPPPPRPTTASTNAP